MCSYIAFIGIYLIGLWNSSDGVRMTLTPNNVVIGGVSNNPTPVPTTLPQQLIMECTPDGTSSIDRINSLKIERRRPPENDFQPFAIIDTDNTPGLTSTAPQDIRNKNPTIDGQLVNSNIYSSVLRVRMMYSNMDCLDEANYRCEINYRDINYDNQNDINEATLGLTVLPGNLQIEGAVYDGYFSNPIQNMSTFDTTRQYEFTCMGEIGQSQSTLIEWYRKVPPYNLNVFQGVVLTNPNDNIDQGSPTTTICPYTRTTKLRYKPTDVNQDLIVRCEIRTVTNTGSPYTAVSQEFHLQSSYRNTNRADTINSMMAAMLLQIFIINIFSIIL